MKIDFLPPIHITQESLVPLIWITNFFRVRPKAITRKNCDGRGMDGVGVDSEQFERHINRVIKSQCVIFLGFFHCYLV